LLLYDTRSTTKILGFGSDFCFPRLCWGWLQHLPTTQFWHRIVAKVDELMALCDQLEQQLSQADQQRRRLLEAVLAEALGGRLPTEQEKSQAAIA
jgi:hypothetical protein